MGVRPVAPVVLDVLAEPAPLEVRGVREARHGGTGGGHQPSQTEELGGRGGQAEASQWSCLTLDEDQSGPAEEGTERHLRDLAGDGQGNGPVETASVRSDDLQQGMTFDAGPGRFLGRVDRSAPGLPEDGRGQRGHPAHCHQLPAQRRPLDQRDPGRGPAADGKHRSHDQAAVHLRGRCGDGSGRRGRPAPVGSSATRVTALRTIRPTSVARSRASCRTSTPPVTGLARASVIPGMRRSAAARNSAVRGRPSTSLTSQR